MTGNRENDLEAAANLLLDARRTNTPIADLPEALRPTNLEEVYAVQDAIAEAYGEIGGWKIGAPTPEATPLFAPMPAVWIAPGGSTLSGNRQFRGLEAEIAFLVGEDLPPRATPYSREEVVAAMASCHPIIEVLEPGLSDPFKADRNSMLADLQVHGGFIYGPAFDNWKSVDFTVEKVTLAVDGVIRIERTGSNTSGDFIKLLPWLANEGAARTGGLRKGQWITTGSWIGYTQADAGSTVDVIFSTVGSVSLRFA
ncbi:MAG TPA: 2-keto-4-pentenoate hydratase [Granulicella sp.]|jgi:2-keto-4-pentenoate hydratase